MGASLEARLRTPDTPDIVVVSRLTEEGWLEARTMGALRARLHARLRGADSHGRYRLYSPYIPGLEGLIAVAVLIGTVVLLVWRRFGVASYGSASTKFSM